jgi:myo-inositol 2-dehydrogenase / D-chiro-inositol 1-dehydrogenase
MTPVKKTSRREFLRSSAATTAAVAGGLSLARGVHAAAVERFNIVLVGAGGRGTGATADCLRVAKHIKLVAIADAFADRAELSRKLLRQSFAEQIDVPDERLFVGLDAYLFPKRLAFDVAPPVLPDKTGSYAHAVPIPGVYRPF